MDYIKRTSIICECCNQEKPWAERSKSYIWIDICDDCEAAFDTADRAHQTNGGTYS